MSHRCLPFLFLNLGGEMMYILDQRLKAQDVELDKAKTVLNDIGKIMLNQKCLDELFKPQEIYNRQALKTLFQDLAHTSIMRLNEISMNKLFDLMIMVFKYQLLQCSQPQDLLLTTLNHIDSIRYLVTSPYCHKQLDSTYFMLIKAYSQTDGGELQSIRYHLLNFFQDIRTRVSIFLRQGLQNNDGSFVISTNSVLPFGFEIPGSIKLFDLEGCICDLINFPSGGDYSVSKEQGSLELRGKRCTALGKNIYTSVKAAEEDGIVWSNGDDVAGLSDQWNFMDTSCGMREELNLLIKQLGGKQHASSDEMIDCLTPLNLFEDERKSVARVEKKNDSKVTSLSAEDPLQSAALQNVLSEMSSAAQPSDSHIGVENEDLIKLMDELDQS